MLFPFSIIIFLNIPPPLFIFTDYYSHSVDFISQIIYQII